MFFVVLIFCAFTIFIVFRIFVALVLFRFAAFGFAHFFIFILFRGSGFFTKADKVCKSKLIVCHS
ncbi:hypothetical protein B9Z91_004805 [Morganella morganii subsp. morganii]|nr:hypothetical protein B9Z91_004805 [Morganella morganii subsp. morganii]